MISSGQQKYRCINHSEFWENNLSWKTLKDYLSDDPDYCANKEFANRVVENLPIAVSYYLGPLSQGLLNKINRERGTDSYTDLYLFLAHPFDTLDGTPKWHKVSLYDARSCSLQSYTSTIALRHFYKVINRERKQKQSNVELLDFCDYQTLLECDLPIEESDSLDQIVVKQAFQTLNERDKLVLRYLVIEKKTGIETYELLQDYITPEPKNGYTSDEIKHSWSLKQKQDAVSLLKGRALKKLLKKFNELKNDNR